MGKCHVGRLGQRVEKKLMRTASGSLHNPADLQILGSKDPAKDSISDSKSNQNWATRALLQTLAGFSEFWSFDSSCSSVVIPTGVRIESAIPRVWKGHLLGREWV